MKSLIIFARDYRGSQISHATNVQKRHMKNIWIKVLKLFPTHRANASLHSDHAINSITLQHVNFNQFLQIEPAID
jgi:hypothetical protein